jgi:transposase-like protein
MSRRANRVLWDQWRERLERQRKSGLSIAEFCRQEEVSSVTFYTWRRKLRGPTAGHSSARGGIPGQGGVTGAGPNSPCRRPRPPRTEAEASGVGGSFLQVPVVEARPAAWIELTLVDGTQVRIPPQNLSALQVVLTVLRGGMVNSPTDEVSHA